MTRATTEGVGWLDELLAPGGRGPEARAQAYFMRGLLAVLQSDPDAARPALEQAVAEARETGQPPLLSGLLFPSSIAQHPGRGCHGRQDPNHTEPSPLPPPRPPL